MRRTQQKVSQSDIECKINTTHKEAYQKHIHLVGYHARQGISTNLENMNDWDPMISKMEDRKCEIEANLMNRVQFPKQNNSTYGS